MKKLAVIAVVFGALFLGSCSKEDIRPNATEQSAPEWRKCKDGAITTTAPQGDGGVVGTTGITDPNNDEDGNGRKKN